MGEQQQDPSQTPVASDSSRRERLLEGTSLKHHTDTS